MNYRQVDSLHNGKRELISTTKTIGAILCVLLINGALMAGCDINDSSETATIVETDFRETVENWDPFFTGYNVGWEDKMNLTSDYRSLPNPLDDDDNAYFISAVNNSDDVKMLFRKQVTSLEPNTTYRVNYTIRFATNEPHGCPGIGGSPGESVKVIADATEERPEPFIDDDYYLLNVQYRHHDNAGEWYQNAILGNIANSRECEEDEVYEIKELNSVPLHSTVTSDENGNVWLLFGTRSGFEGETELYYTWFSAEFSLI